MTGAIMRCKRCDQPIMRYTNAMKRHPKFPSIVNKAFKAHHCDALQCPACGRIVAATRDLPQHLISSVLHNHRRYCKGTPT